MLFGGVGMGDNSDSNLIGFPIEAGLEMDWTSCQSGLAICNPYMPGCYEA